MNARNLRLGDEKLMKKRGKWTKFRHRVAFVLARPVAALIAGLKYHAKVHRFAEQGDRNWLVLSNHQTNFDPAFIAYAMRKPVYFVALEDLFSNGWISRVIEWLFAPIPFMKATSDPRAVMNCIRIAREGGSIALFPEGNRTYSGRSCYIKPSVAALAKKLGLPIALFRIEGGYSVKPRWSDVFRKGRMTVGVSRIIEPEEYQSMSKEELYDLICKELQVDETALDRAYSNRKLAEHLERVLYVCPACGLTEFDTQGDLLTCRRCGKQHRYLPDQHLAALNGETSFSNAADWYDWQETYIRKLDLAPYSEKAMYEETADLFEVAAMDCKKLVQKSVPVRIYGDRLELAPENGPLILSYSDIQAMGCIVGHKLNIFYGDRIYQLRGDTHFNALKYCNIYYHAKFIKEGHEDGEFQFLGL